MRQKPGTKQSHGEEAHKDIRRATRKQYPAEEKIRIVLDALLGASGGGAGENEYAAFQAWCAELLSRTAFSSKSLRSIKILRIQNVKKYPGIRRVFSRAAILVETGLHRSPGAAWYFGRRRRIPAADRI